MKANSQIATYIVVGMMFGFIIYYTMEPGNGSVIAGLLGISTAITFVVLAGALEKNETDDADPAGESNKAEDEELTKQEESQRPHPEA